MNRDRVVFFGTPALCLPFLERLTDAFDVPLVITQPDTFGGRNRKRLIVPAVKAFAMERGIEVLQPENLKDDGLVEKIRSVDPAIGVVISYGRMIPKRIFRAPRLNTVNVHFSLLPFYRGAAPVQRAIQRGERVSGITIFELRKKLDAGDVWDRLEVEILPGDTSEALFGRMCELGAPFLVETLQRILSGQLVKVPQDHDCATYAPPIKKEEGVVDWRASAPEIYNTFRAFQPWPGVSFYARERLFKLTRIRVSADSHDGEPGQVISRDKECLKISCGGGTVLEIIELQPPGKKPMTPHCYCMGNEFPDCVF